MKKTENKKIRFEYGDGVCVLPCGIHNLMDKAKKFDIKVLLLLSSADKYREGKYLKELALALECEESEIESSLAFWRGAGVISILEGATKAKSEKTEKVEKAEKTETEKNVPKRAKVSELPQYTSNELNALLEKNRFVVGLIDECQNVLGKMFTASEIKVLMGLVDYLGLDEDYILVLMNYCARHEHKNMRYVEKLAIACLDEGLTEAPVLENALLEREARESIEGKIKTLFGMGKRAFTTKEKKQIDAWINDYKYGVEIIERAYDITVAATKEPSIHYANAIIEKWNANGIKTLAEIDALYASREEQKALDGSSFDVDDFFDAALKKSYSGK